MSNLTLHAQPVEVRLGAVDPRLGAAAPHHVHAGLHGEEDLVSGRRRLDSGQRAVGADLDLVAEATVRRLHAGEPGAPCDDPDRRVRDARCD